MDPKLNEILAQVFNLESPDSIKDTDSLINDLGADSLDFVEIIHLIERNFGVIIKTNEIMLGGKDLTMEQLFADGRLTSRGAESLKEAFSGKKDMFREGMTKVELFTLLTVGDLEGIIRSKMVSGGANAC
jgi:acyl carrier protein